LASLRVHQELPVFILCCCSRRPRPWTGRMSEPIPTPSLCRDCDDDQAGLKIANHPVANREDSMMTSIPPTSKLIIAT
jgi:hypothetical protein